MDGLIMKELTAWLQVQLADCDRNLTNLRHHEEVAGESEDGPTVTKEESFKSALEFVLHHIKNDN